MAGNAQTQADQRRSINPRDQFGRKWAGTIEVRTGDFTGGIFAAWGALGDPLRTPMHLIRMVKNEDGQAMLGQVVVDFDRWIQDAESAEEIWYRQLIENALLKNVDITDLEALTRHKILLGLTGPKPWPSAEVLRLAKGGDKELLGMEPMTAKTRAVLGKSSLEDIKSKQLQAADAATTAEDLTPPDDYKSFVGWALAHGCANFSEVGKAWTDHKANLAAV